MQMWYSSGNPEQKNSSSGHSHPGAWGSFAEAQVLLCEKKRPQKMY